MTKESFKHDWKKKVSMTFGVIGMFVYSTFEYRSSINTPYPMHSAEILPIMLVSFVVILLIVYGLLIVIEEIIKSIRLKYKVNRAMNSLGKNK